jgi:hypothetical protein
MKPKRKQKRATSEAADPNAVISAVSRGVDWDRLAMQEGLMAIPAHHPDREYIEAEKAAVAKLSKEDRVLRDRIIYHKARIQNYCEKQWTPNNVVDRLRYIRGEKNEFKDFVYKTKKT